MKNELWQLSACELADGIRKKQFLAEEVINSVRYHTTGHPEMTDIEKIVFIADKVEPDKVQRNPELELVVSRMEVNLDTTVLEYLKLRIGSILDKKGVVHPLAIDTWNYFLQKNS